MASAFIITENRANIEMCDEPAGEKTQHICQALLMLSASDQRCFTVRLYFWTFFLTNYLWKFALSLHNSVDFAFQRFFLSLLMSIPQREIKWNANWNQRKNARRKNLPTQARPTRDVLLLRLIFCFGGQFVRWL